MMFVAQLHRCPGLQKVSRLLCAAAATAQTTAQVSCRRVCPPAASSERSSARGSALSVRAAAAARREAAYSPSDIHVWIPHERSPAPRCSRSRRHTLQTRSECPAGGGRLWEEGETGGGEQERPSLSPSELSTEVPTPLSPSGSLTHARTLSHAHGSCCPYEDRASTSMESARTQMFLLTIRVRLALELHANQSSSAVTSALLWTGF